MLEAGSSIADSVGFVRAAFSAVAPALVEWRTRLGGSPHTRAVDGESRAVASLSPERHPWAAEGLLRCEGDEWTAYLNEGADPWPAVSYVARCLSADGVVAVNSSRPPHASTQFQLMGPTGKPPLLFVRTLAAHCEDGRWSWHEDGQQQAFEVPDRYSARRIRDRLDRPLLVQYLSALGIDIDGVNFVGSGLIIAPTSRAAA